MQDSGADFDPRVGSYVGTISWRMNEWDWTICEAAEVELELADDGDLTGVGVCTFVSDEWSEDLGWSVDGSVDDGGDVQGEIVWDTWAIVGNAYAVEDIDSDLEGSLVGATLEIDFEASSYMGQYGFVPVSGQIRADLVEADPD